VQAYYTAYHVTQALIVAKGNKRPTTHPQTQRQYANLWVDRPLDLPPWTFGIASSGLKNLPAGVTIDRTVHQWTTCNKCNCWSLSAKLLKTTRDQAVKKSMDSKRDEGRRERKREWEAQEAQRLLDGKKARAAKTFARPQLTSIERQACDKDIRTYTILDYLYRLRVGANYDDAGVIVDGPETEADSYLLHKRLNYLTAGLALISEMRIRDLVGATQFRKWSDDFVTNNIPSGYTLGIKERLALL
jgi:hypothetical protein